MIAFVRRPKLLTWATVPLIVLAMLRPAYAESQRSPAHAVGIPIALDRPAAPHAPPRAQGMPGDATSPHAALVRPIVTPPPIIGVQSAPVAVPGTYGLQATASSVTVQWSDRSNNEQGFVVYRRDLAGNWQIVDQVPTRDMAGTGAVYTWVDTSTDLSGQCYMIAAYAGLVSSTTNEQCTVRPDPSRFPQVVGSYAVQWSGLSDSNDGTGQLVDTNLEQDLLYGDQTWGVNLTWGVNSLWRVEAQGGPHLMKGQAVALKVWGGGWLKYGHEDWGVDLQFSSTPVYEWYAIGIQGDSSESTLAGYPLTDAGTFALWNSSAQAYLVHGHQTLGVSLAWYKVGSGLPPTPTPTPVTQHGARIERVFNCSDDERAVEVWIADQTLGGGFVDEGLVESQYGSDGCPTYGSVPLTFTPISGHHYRLVATDSMLPGCDGNDPQQGQCQKMDVQFDGDAHGYTYTDTVGGYRVITP
jgi:hypothetical protein